MKKIFDSNNQGSAAIWVAVIAAITIIIVAGLFLYSQPQQLANLLPGMANFLQKEKTKTAEEVQVSCGDGACSGGENCSSCLEDCKCSEEETCTEEGECLNPNISDISDVIDKSLLGRVRIPRPSICGDGACSGSESSASCCQDCGCSAGKYCLDQECKTISREFSPSWLKPIHISTGTSYIVALLEEIKVLHNGDGAGEIGELMLAAEANSGSSKQRMKWPIHLWTEESDNETIFGGDRNAIPLFALKESEMGDDLNFKLWAADSDYDLSAISFKCSPHVIYNEHPGLPEPCELVGNCEEYDMLDYNTPTEDIGPILNCQGNDNMGEVTATFSKVNDWGVSDNIYEESRGNIIVKYSIKRVTVPDNMPVSVKIKKITINKDGDSGSNKGDIRVFTRVADRFGENGFGMSFSDTEHYKYRFVGNQEYSMSDGDTQVFDQEIYCSNDLGPFLYVEADVLDADNDCGEKPYYCEFQEVGTLSLTWLASEAELINESGRTITIPISERRTSSGGDVNIELEITRTPYPSGVNTCTL